MFTEAAQAAVAVEPLGRIMGQDIIAWMPASTAAHAL